ncbi:MAG: thioredoxin family protein [Microbacteriaceae bacterium]|nr:MAG: thioredoxin family protein [Microbacteriaceae bacterium]
MTTITLLTQSSCTSCEHAKEVLARLTREFPLQITEIGLATEEGFALAARHGVVFAPGVLVDGDMFSYGRLPEKKLRRYLSQQHPAGNANA